MFARFYFLSNEDLLDILANCKNPNAVQVCKPSYTLTNPLFSPGTEQVFSVKIRVGDKSLGMSFGGWGGGWSGSSPSDNFKSLTLLTLYSLTSVCIFSILLPRHFPGFLQGEFVEQSRASQFSW